MKKKNLRIGSGFSATVTKLYIGKFSKIISLYNYLLFRKDEFVRRKEVECNKLFAKKKCKKLI